MPYQYQMKHAPERTQKPLRDTEKQKGTTKTTHPKKIRLKRKTERFTTIIYYHPNSISKIWHFYKNLVSKWRELLKTS